MNRGDCNSRYNPSSYAPRGSWHRVAFRLATFTGAAGSVGSYSSLSKKPKMYMLSLVAGPLEQRQVGRKGEGGEVVGAQSPSHVVV